MTDLASLSLPVELAAWVREADPAIEIFEHAIRVDLDWWNAGLADRSLPGGPVRGLNEAGEITTSGWGRIRRADLFDLSQGAAKDPTTAQALLWHTLAWGSGTKVRKNHQRMDVVASDARAGQVLVDAARLARTNPAAAYEVLRPSKRNRFTHLGPAFFTKYLYFAGGPTLDNPCLILDSVVASALSDRGWTSLRASGWPTATYIRYLSLVDRWRAAIAANATDSSLPRRDLFEKYLFTH